MNSWLRLTKYELLNIMRSHWMLGYMLFWLCLSALFYYFVADVPKVTTTLASLLVVLIPTVSALFAAFTWYQADRHTQLMLTQPLSRCSLFWARYLALVVTLILSFVVGITLPFVIVGKLRLSLLLLAGVGSLLTIIFTAIGIGIAVRFNDRMWGIGVTFLLSVYCAMVHDAMLLGLLLVLSDYPMDFPAAILGSINPLGLARVVLLMKQETAMLLGHSGALMRQLLTTGTGLYLAMGLALAWVSLPLIWAWRSFRRSDL